jgi:cytochrome c551/c552
MAGRHRTIEGTTSGWNPAASRHVECEDCHDPHASKPGTTAPAYITTRAADTVPAIAGANNGAWGVTFNASMSAGNWTGLGVFGNPTTPTAANYVRVESASYQWQLCLKCHSAYAWTTTPPSVSTNLQGQANGKQTDIGGDFNPMNLAVHPIFAQGKNQPPTNANSAWTAAGGARLNATTIGLANTMTDGWLTTSRVVCTDCHNNDDPNGSSGPHGSNNRWIIAGVDRNTKVTLWDGTVSYVNNNALIPSSNFCVNCHRADVYGFGRTGAGTTDGTYGTLSRVNHSGFNASCGDPANLGTVLQYTGCLGCHGGRKDQRSYGNPTTSTVPVQSGAIHGTRMTYDPTGAGSTDSMGYRFLNGASWHSHALGDSSGSGGCYTAGKSSPAADNYSSCTQHGTGRSFTPQYYYARPTN